MLVMNRLVLKWNYVMNRRHICFCFCFQSLDHSTTFSEINFVGLLYHLAAAIFFIYTKLETNTLLAKLREEKGLVLPHMDDYGGQWKDFIHLNFVS